MSPGVAFTDEVAEVGIPTSGLYNVETEQVLLGAIISQRDALSKVDHIITVEDFYDQSAITSKAAAALAAG